ncbi:probable RNA-dependent RNA polymerase 1 [Andrographis paniculata]|uniref:probable RNA-dependent RNA polymerase 1 n=1 Tax=Andrographis paniculata TaxID=175694 RepID=UPI0021E6EE61|nr:probable RNA-dependent RNA polymerase 1 [Andrographis paniculata]
MAKATIQLHGFPHLVSADVVKRLLEQRLGQGSVVALEVKPSKKGGRVYARVQFTSSAYAQKIIDMASSGLYYGSSYLRAWESDMDIVHHVRLHLYEMENVTLNSGCQVSSDKFMVLWKAENVSVKFGIGMKKMHFFLSHDSVHYRLQLSYENIWQIVLYHQLGLTSRFLLIQLYGAPRIYKKVGENESIYSFFKETPDDQWIRTTDFTPSSCIGQSSGLCLKLPYNVQLPRFKDNFVYYSEKETTFRLENGIPFCRNLPLVPIVQPPRGSKLPYKVLFKVCYLVQTGCLPGLKLDGRFFSLVNPQRYDIRFVEHALDKLYYMKECCYDPVSWLIQEYGKYSRGQEHLKPSTVRLDNGLVYVHRVQVTPTRVYFMGPEVNVSNRVLRHFNQYNDNFLRVSFVDEEWEKMYSTDLSPRVVEAGGVKRTKLYERVLSILREGITIGDKKFDFLAFSSSQLRENSLWMFASTNDVDAYVIRQWMGDFRSIRNVAKYAARLGQSFSSSTETLTVPDYEVERIPDIVTNRGRTKYVFSDGIGKISAAFARRVAAKCGVNGSVPSAFQIRYGGYKGVVAVDPDSSAKLSLRPSMLKYESDNTKLDVLAWSKYQPCFLNRQIITLLSTLGVRDSIFERKQRDAVAQLDEILVNPVRAEEVLDLMSPGETTNILKELLKCGYKPNVEPFLSMMLQTFRASKLLDLRMKARVFVPEARQMMGCLDETGILNYGQVFVQFSGARRSFDGASTYGSSECRYTIEGDVVVAKNPCLHPGDVRVLKAIDVKALHHMVDCIVFPSKGPRPHPNECSGSDLDGDIYFVSWDSDLIPPKQVPPMDYNPAPNTVLDHNVTIEEVEEYFTNYIVNDTLGIIANAHTVFADREVSMAESKPCLELARLFSVAVDFPKTGVPAEIPPHLRVKDYPDFMEKLDKSTYDSTRVIGKLFRAVKDIPPHALRSFTKEVARRSYDPDMEVDGFEEYIDEAFEWKEEYDYKLGNFMEYYGIKTEAEILSGSVMKMSKSFDRRRDAEAVAVAVRSLRSEARTWFKRASDDEDEDGINARASAWYYVTYHPDYWGLYNVGLKRDHYISFPWCVYDKLVRIKKSKQRREASVAQLYRHFRGGLSVG